MKSFVIKLKKNSLFLFFIVELPNKQYSQTLELRYMQISIWIFFRYFFKKFTNIFVFFCRITG
jgi:hypothetical protein